MEFKHEQLFNYIQLLDKKSKEKLIEDLCCYNEEEILEELSYKWDFSRRSW